MNARAFVFTGVEKPFEAREFPLPEVEPGGILVRVTVANICGSDLHGCTVARRGAARPSWGTR